VFEPCVVRLRGQLEGINLSFSQVSKFTLAVRIGALTDHPFAVSLFVTNEHFFRRARGIDSSRDYCWRLLRGPLAASAKALFGRR
jgi:hypothetical protein